ncbi:MAG TPA: Hpt domain-containing protein [Kofleriaceae bacterium]|jgi:HPt (histidine-containing phosphotransfer) domain-containing protein|nr:Hpt domain-containing protein [Kofleriaceae bacterium]
MDELSAKFLPQFLELARARLAAALKAAAARDHVATTTTVRNMHTLAGEAGLLGLHDVVPLAREGEQRAKSLSASRTDADAELLVDVLRRLEQVIESIGATYMSQ